MINTRKLTDNVPEVMKKQCAWVGYITKPNGQRMDKIPMDVMKGIPAKSNDPETWTDFDTALDLAVQRRYDGVGFMFSSPFGGIDIDHCVQDGQISEMAKDVLRTMNIYAEYSPSGKGIHLIFMGEIKQNRRVTAKGLEIYTKGRFFTVTGDRLMDYSGEVIDRSEALNQIWSKYFEPIKQDDIFSKIAKSKDADKFNKLFAGQWQGNYPSQSEADLALCNKLAFWTGKDANKMDALFRQSGLFRAKWDEKHFGDGRTYGQSVIEKAITSCSASYDDPPSEHFRPHRRDKIPQGEIITRDCEENIKQFFQDQQGNCFVVLPFDSHQEVCLTDSSRFRNWMAKRYRDAYGAPPNNEALKQARVQVEAICESSPKVELFNRVGWHDDAIYYDLTTPDWKGIKLTKDGWDIVPLPSIFRRYNHQSQQVIPVKGGDPKEILKFCNVAKEDYCLFMVTIATFFIPNIPHVIPTQSGEQGTGKSNNSRKIKGLSDPSKVMLISAPKDLEQAQMIADKHWINNFDNISRIPEWLSDFLCRAVTGEGDMKRSLYTNDDEYIRSYRRCFVLNGIGVSAWRPDLLDRSIVFDIPILSQRRPERLIEKDWNEALPRILGGFFTTIAKAMNSVDAVTGHEKFRMADFAQWGASLADELGFSREEFFRKYQDSVNRKWQDTAEDSTFAAKIRNLVESNAGFWQGSVSAILEKIKSSNGFDKNIPQTPKALAAELMRLAPVMRNVGIDIIRSEKREAGTGRKVFIFRKRPEELSEPRPF
jgi:hypothetical protein